ncbi:MAG: hypothetical protein BGWL_c3720 [Candidatus Phytoplasma cynodontis]|nr:MAG: hypothetical protein BGWL_c2510 [Candidatus Phytoplasma cynodontis]WIA07749.1 MAG: hypothetical protein BGWL_c2620 [Candidatus Phytoplasma cynodontis]WIA07856.1 MAG: hypothetical protein BGWL_c3720 [Candidatus Phytoplasma cynodontis]
MNVCEVLLNLNDDNVLCFLPPQIIYFYPAQKGLVKEVIVTDLENQEKHHWWFYQNQILNKYQKYSLKHQKIISEKIYYSSGQLKRYTEYHLLKPGYLYTESYDRQGNLDCRRGTSHV